MQISLPEKSETKEGICHPFREEDTPYAGWNFREGESDTTNDDVLEYCCISTERGSLVWLQEVSFPDELYRELHHWCGSQPLQTIVRHRDLQRKGSTLTANNNTETKPA